MFSCCCNAMFSDIFYSLYVLSDALKFCIYMLKERASWCTDGFEDFEVYVDLMRFTDCKLRIRVSASNFFLSQKLLQVEI